MKRSDFLKTLVSPLALVGFSDTTLAAIIAVSAHATLIGNNAYKNPLRLASKDAQDMAAMFGELKIANSVHANLTNLQIQRVLGEAAQRKGPAIVFFSGIGATSSSGRLSLLGVDSDRKMAGVSLENVAKQFTRGLVLLLDTDFNTSTAPKLRNTLDLHLPDRCYCVIGANRHTHSLEQRDDDNGLLTKHLLREVPKPQTLVESLWAVKVGVEADSNGESEPVVAITGRSTLRITDLGDGR